MQTVTIYVLGISRDISVYVLKGAVGVIQRINVLVSGEHQIRLYLSVIRLRYCSVFLNNEEHVGWILMDLSKAVDALPHCLLRAYR